MSIFLISVSVKTDWESFVFFKLRVLYMEEFIVLNVEGICFLVAKIYELNNYKFHVQFLSY